VSDDDDTVLIPKVGATRRDIQQAKERSRRGAGVWAWWIYSLVVVAVMGGASYLAVR